MKNIRIFLSENFPFLVVTFSTYLNRRVFVMTFSLKIALSRANESQRQNAYFRTCMPSKNSDQPAHLCLIGIFTGYISDRQ